VFNIFLCINVKTFHRSAYTIRHFFKKLQYLFIFILILFFVITSILCHTFDKDNAVFLSVDGNLLSQAFLWISRKRTLPLEAAGESSGLGVEGTSPAISANNNIQ
jgi:hypothetical protein